MPMDKTETPGFKEDAGADGTRFRPRSGRSTGFALGAPPVEREAALAVPPAVDYDASEEESLVRRLTQLGYFE